MTARPALASTMGGDEPTSRGFSLKRWSRKKLEAARAAPAPAAAPAAVPALQRAEAGTPQPVGAPPTGPSNTAPIVAPASEAAALPPVESLTIDSDFAAFLQPKVDEALKRQALKQLFRDPRFNVMDGLDVYIDDYSKPDPISPDVVRQLVQGRYIFDPPATRVNERGEVEDVPPEDAAVERATGEPAAVPGALPENAPAAADGAAPEAPASAPPDVAPESADAPVLAIVAPQPEQRDSAVPAQPERPDAALTAPPERPDAVPR